MKKPKKNTDKTNRFSTNCQLPATNYQLSPSTVSRRLAEFNRWRRGQGKYAFSEDPAKNASLPFTATYLGEVIDRAVEILKGIKA